MPNKITLSDRALSAAQRFIIFKTAMIEMARAEPFPDEFVEEVALAEKLSITEGRWMLRKFLSFEHVVRKPITLDAVRVLVSSYVPPRKITLEEIQRKTAAYFGTRVSS